MTFLHYFIFDRIVCFGDFLPMKTLCDAYHKEFESHYCSILDIPEYFEEYVGYLMLLQPSHVVVVYLLVIITVILLKFYL